MNALEILVARNSRCDLSLLAKMANRHGLIAGATGTGKTVTLQVLAEGFSSMGVPVFLADVKGDLAGISQPGGQSPKVQERVAELKLDDYVPVGFPVTFWDVFGEKGHPVRATVSEFGPLMLARLLQLNEIQAAVLNIIFKVADDNKLLLLDLKDLRAMCEFVAQNASSLSARYGNISGASVGAIQRGLLQLESQGAEAFFSEPALNLDDLMQTDSAGRGIVNILAADRLLQSPRIYATLLLWMLSELFERLPEVGDPAKPKLVFFFDEAHLLFNESPPPLLEKIEQVARLIRSKGVGAYFITQNPRDVPDNVLGQLSNRVQHALRAFTPRDQKAVQAAAETFRTNPRLDTAATIMELGVGEALVSFLDEQGQPGIVQRALIVPPRSQVGPISDIQRRQVMSSSLVAGVYEKRLDRESAYEILQAAHAQTPPPIGGRPAPQTPAPAPQSEERGFWGSIFGTGGAGRPSRGRQPDSLAEVMAKSAVRSIGSTAGRELMRGILGTLLGGGRRRR
jgi:DNA helicase HerA-like ATPase